MRNLGKILAVVIAMSMLLGVVAFGATFTDVKDTDSSAEAVSVLSSLGIIAGYPDGTFGPEKSITRAEFSAVVDRAKALGDSADAAKGATPFKDVPADHWATGYINLAFQQGIVNGMDKDTFAPDKEVTFAQAVKMIVASLGYEPQAKSLGGWPSGYLAVAAQKGVTKGVSASKETQPATRATVAKMLYNSLDIPLMEQTGFGTDIKFEAGAKLLLDGLDVTKVEGKVTNTKYSATGSSGIKNDEVAFAVTKVYVAIAGKLYTKNPGTDNDVSSTYSAVKVGGTNAKDLLQYSTVAYIKSIDDTPELAAIAQKSGKNKTITVKSSDIRNELIIGMGTTAITAYDFTYYTDKDNSKDDKVTIAASADYYYNGSKTSNSRPFGGLSGDAFTLTKAGFTGGTGGKLEGVVTLLNNDDDDDYDVVFVEEANDFIVDEVNTKTYKVTSKIINKTPSTIEFDLENKDYDFTFIKDGKTVKLEDIKTDDVLSLIGYINSNNEVEFGKAIITSNIVKGKVSELNTADQKVVVGDKTFKYTDYVRDNQINKLSAGSEGSYYVNANDKICASDSKITNTVDAKLLYVTKIASSGTISSNVQLRGLTTKGEWKTFDLASKVSFNADTINTSPSSIDVDNTTDFRTLVLAHTTAPIYAPAVKATTDSYLIYAVVSYDVNSDGKINKIDFYPDAVALRDDSNFYVKDFLTNTSSYDKTNKKLAGSLYVNDATVIFNVDGTPITGTTGLVEDKITVTKADVLMDGTVYTGTAYNVNDNDEATVIVGSGYTGVLDYSSNFMVVDTVGTAMNSNGDSVFKLTGFQKGEKVTVTTANDAVYEQADLSTTVGNVLTSSAADLKKGSVIIFTKNVKGEIDKSMILFNANTVKVGTTIARPAIATAVKLFMKTSGSDDNTFVLGYAYEKSGTRYTLVSDVTTVNSDATNLVASFAPTNYVYAYDAFYSNGDGQVKVTDASDVNTDNSLVDGTPIRDANNVITGYNNVINGDFVFAHLDDGGRIVDAVVIKKNSN